MRYHRITLHFAFLALVLLVLFNAELRAQQPTFPYEQQRAEYAYPPPARAASVQPAPSDRWVPNDVRAAGTQPSPRSYDPTRGYAPAPTGPTQPMPGYGAPTAPTNSRRSGFAPLAGQQPPQAQVPRWPATAPAQPPAQSGLPVQNRIPSAHRPAAPAPVNPPPAQANPAPAAAPPDVAPVGQPGLVSPAPTQPAVQNAPPTAAPAATTPAATTPAATTPAATANTVASGSTTEAKADAEADENESAEAEGLTVEQVKNVITAIEASESIEDEKKKEYTEYLNQAMKWLANATEYETKAAQYEGEAKSAPKLLEEAKKELATPLTATQPEIAPDAKLSQLEQVQTQAEEELETARKELEKREAAVDTKGRADRKAELAKRKESAKEQLEAAETELAGISSTDESDPATAARLTELKARQRSLEQQIRVIDAERNRFDALVELFPVQRDLAQRRVTAAEKQLEIWQQTVTDFRKAESQRQAAEARRIASQAHPAVRDLAERNAQLAESRKLLSGNMEKVSGYLESVREKNTDLDKDFQDVTGKVEVYGMTPTVGMLLRNRRDHLPNTTVQKERIAFSQSEMQAAQVSLLELADERAGDIEQNIELAIEELGSVTTQFQPGYLENMVRQLLQGRNEYLDSLLLDFNTYHDDLSSLELETRDLLDKVFTYRSYVDEHVLWIPSSAPISKADLSDSASGLGSFFDIGRWAEVLASTIGNVGQNPSASIGLVLVCVALIVFRKQILKRLEERGGQVTEDPLSFIPTMWALAMTVLLAAVCPLMFWGIGWWMTLNENATDLASGLASGFKSIAMAYFVIELFRQICRPGGLADKHFGWPQEGVEVAYRSLNWLAVLGLPMLFLVSLFSMHDEGQWRDSLGRIAMLAGLAVLTIYLHYVFHPRKGAVPNALRGLAVPWLFRMRHTWYILGIGCPLVLGVLLVLGYTYSVDELMKRAGLVVCLALGALLAQELASRALLVAWNRLKARRLKEQTATVNSEIPSEESTLDDVVTEEQTEFEKVDQQLAQLVRATAVLAFLVCNWFVWSDVLPALQVLDRVELWNTTVMVTQEMQAANDTVVTERVPKDVPVTLANLMVSVIALIATFMAAKTLPGLLEVSVLGRLPMDKGARHATVIISRYVVSMAGFVLACRMLGVGWSSVQWLIAAMSVGLGFGLQEIFANLVSGLIILFERPIRIGDLVTVNGQTGKITRMQIRATTITDFDRRELIVPNKRFITDDVVNWTLSDPITRFVIPIGISYDSDPAQAHALLLDVARRHPLILDEPAPSAVFLGFGDSTLDLELRSFIGRREDYGTVLHEVNLAIERTFREANIDIAFPQQEIHIRSLPDVLQIPSQPETAVPPAKAA